VIKKPCGRGDHSLPWAEVPEKITIIFVLMLVLHKKYNFVITILKNARLNYED
jgi:hypothetical protein